MKSFLSLAACAALLVFSAGCASINPLNVDAGPVYTPANARGPELWPVELRRVAVLPAHDTTSTLQPDFMSAYDGLWRRALDRTQRAEFVSVPTPALALWTGHDSYASTALLPPGLIERVVRETGAQAVLFLDLTTNKPYPPLALGFRVRLVDTNTRETIWTADELFDAGNSDVARAARHYARAQASGVGDEAHGILQSPSRFADYAFQAVARLLPPRRAAITAESAEKKATKTADRADSAK